MIVLLLAATLSAEPTAAELLERAITTTAAKADARAHYIFREHSEHLRPDGKLNHTDDYEWIFLEGAPYRKHISSDGKPLTGKALKEEERLFQMTAAERRADAQHRKPNPHIVSADIAPDIVLRSMNHSLAADELINARPSWVIHSEPKPDITSEARAYRFTFWIDKAELAIAQVHYDIFQSGAKVLPGSSQTTTYSRVAEDVWLLNFREGEYYSGPPRPKGHWKQTHRLGDYRKFGTESTVLFEH